jgi:hypothetical protein
MIPEIARKASLTTSARGTHRADTGAHLNCFEDNYATMDATAAEVRYT